MTRATEPEPWIDARLVATIVGLWVLAIGGVLFMGSWMASQIGREWR